MGLTGRSGEVDPEYLARKNAERYRRLKEMEQENSLSNVDDSEEVSVDRKHCPKFVLST